jgi:phosphate acetyltransferase
MGLIEQFIERARQTPKRIVLPEGDDPQIVQAACRLAQGGIAHPVLLGDASRIADLAAGRPLRGVRIVDPASPDLVRRFAAAYSCRRDNVTESVALRLVRRPLMFGAMMVAEGEADAMVGGITKPTAQVISAASLAIGYAAGISSASSFFIMVLPGEPERVLVYADAAVAVDPTPAELAEIAVVTARNTRALLQIDPKVAMVSFSTRGSAQHPRVDKVRQAVSLVRLLDPGLCVDGELQVDAALSPRVAARKAPDSPLHGQANVLVFADLDVGNVAYKLTQYLAGAQAIGPIMQGFRLPVNDLSRGATADDIIGVAAIAALQVGA